MLDESDMKLPFRNKKNAHKGTYGHLNVYVGDKKGAGIISSKAAFGFGVGLVSAISHENLDLPYHIMQTQNISENCTAIAIGMGLGKYETNEIREILNSKIPKIIDADLFYDKIVLECFNQEVVSYNILHKIGYEQAKTLVPSLPTTLLQASAKQACEAVKSFNSNYKNYNKKTILLAYY